MSPPLYFVLMCERLLRTTPALARELWKALTQLRPEHEQTLRYTLDQILSPTGSVDLFWGRMLHVEQVLTPADLLMASLQVCPEGHRRRRDIVQFEQRVLECVDAHGAWL